MLFPCFINRFLITYNFQISNVRHAWTMSINYFFSKYNCSIQTPIYWRVNSVNKKSFDAGWLLFKFGSEKSAVNINTATNGKQMTLIDNALFAFVCGGKEIKNAKRRCQIRVCFWNRYFTLSIGSCPFDVASNVI